MLTFTLKSLGQKLITLMLVSILSFLVIKLAPGRPSQIDPMNPRFTQADLERFRKAFDLDKPLPQQFFLFYKKFFAGQLLSYKDSQPVLKNILHRSINSLPLFLFGTLLTWTLAFPTGIAGAIRRGSVWDRTSTILSYAILSIPSFLLAYLLIKFIVPRFHLPVLGLETFGVSRDVTWLYVQDRIWHLVLPSILIVTAEIAYLSRYVRDQMLEVIHSDYVRTARAKGCEEGRVYYHHALRNALLPFVTMFGLMLPGLIGGLVIIETIFAWPGMGRLGYEAVLARDYPTIIALNFINAILVLLGTLISDLLYMVVDPRIKA